MLRGGFIKCGNCGNNAGDDAATLEWEVSTSAISARPIGGRAEIASTTPSGRHLDAEVWLRIERLLNEPGRRPRATRGADSDINSEITAIDGRIAELRQEGSRLAKMAARLDEGDDAVEGLLDEDA